MLNSIKNPKSNIKHRLQSTIQNPKFSYHPPIRPVEAPATPSSQDSLDMIQLKKSKSSSSIGTFSSLLE